ncbi:integration host factor subunit alpha [Novosphingobium sp. P6W]|uniref:integration host factor subunit alpha n=1 Tax=Novosphingobium sp. P6W TaxID=1609758 RepID=UPI0009E2F709|nr:integration host factor subunit alpha [Novosphingobium sp. P6W]AXB79135.1 integration host factor subunit alpha [Novosphingobium sp. P6W]
MILVLGTISSFASGRRIGVVQGTGSLTRAEIAETIRRKVGISGVDAREIVDAILDHMASRLEQGANVKITTFGTFVLHDKSKRVGRNPRSGSEHAISARRVVTFRANGHLKARLARSAT